MMAPRYRPLARSQYTVPSCQPRWSPVGDRSFPAPATVSPLLWRLPLVPRPDRPLTRLTECPAGVLGVAPSGRPQPRDEGPRPGRLDADHLAEDAVVPGGTPLRAPVGHAPQRRGPTPDPVVQRHHQPPFAPVGLPHPDGHRVPGPPASAGRHPGHRPVRGAEAGERFPL